MKITIEIPNDIISKNNLEENTYAVKKCFGLAGIELSDIDILKMAVELGINQHVINTMTALKNNANKVIENN